MNFLGKVVTYVAGGVQALIAWTVAGSGFITGVIVTKKVLDKIINKKQKNEDIID